MNNMVNPSNGLAVNQVVSRQMQEVQGAIFMAKQFPRDIDFALQNIKTVCENKRVAEAAEYIFPRAGQEIVGPSIRLAEVVAQAWGNIDYGIIELTNENGLSEMMAYAWDLQTNVRRQMIFTVKHERDTRSGKRKLTDNHDIYELTANMGSRRVRACILGVIPSFVVDEALETCKKTREDNIKKKTSIADEIAKTVKAFETKMQVPVTTLEKYIDKPTTEWSAEDVEKLRSVWRSIQEGAAGKFDFFPDLQVAKMPEKVQETENAAAQLNGQLGLEGEQNDA